MLNWTIEVRNFTLRYNWKLSRNESTEKTNFIVKVSDGAYTGMGEIAPNIRYNESPDSVMRDFELFMANPLNKIFNAPEIEEFINNLDISNAVKFGITSAAVHLLCKQQGVSVSKLLNFTGPPQKVGTCYTLPIMDIGAVKSFIDTNDLRRFGSLKIKINKETGTEMVREVAKCSSQPLKIDANESWNDVEDFLGFVEEIKKLNVQFLEQPFPSSLIEEYKYAKHRSFFELFADESVLSEVDFDLISQQFHGINMKLMKAGSYYKGLKIIEKSRQYGLKTMVGCMVESTLGISSAMNFGGIADYTDLDGFFIIKNEPFNLVKELNGMLYLNDKSEYN